MRNEDAPGGGNLAGSRPRGAGNLREPPRSWSDGRQGGEGGTPRPLSKDRRHVRLLRPVQAFGGLAQGGSGRKRREGVLMMAQLGFPSNLAGWGPNLCLKNNPM